MSKVGIGIIGCGNISDAYLRAASLFPILDVKALADLRPKAAQARANQFGLRACSVDALLRDPDIEIVLNLTIPAAHVEVGLQAIAASIAMSFDVPKHRHTPIELYGSQASMIVPDPNHFGGTIEIARPGEEWEVQGTQHPYADGNFRIIGVADMAHAIRDNQPHRASAELALHVLEVMEAFQASSDLGRHVDIATRPERPAPLPRDRFAGVVGAAH